LDISRRDKKAQERAKRSPPLPSLRPGRSDTETAKPKSTDGKERLQKILANAGVCSRRQAEELILLGQVTVNGKVVSELGAKADPREDNIAVEGKSIDPDGVEKIYLLLNKPRGYVTTTMDPQGRPTVMELIGAIKERVYPVGRLDYASEGLLLLTNDGDLAHKLMHPSSQVHRRYAVKVKGMVPDHALREMRKGIQLSDGFVKPVRVARGDRLQGKEWIEIDLTEGRNLEVRRIFAVLELEVERLRRVAIGSITIDRVPVGKTVRIHKRELEELLRPPLSKSGKID
jgi:23S rRNA pseudouridine2605 synthase